MVGCTNKMDYKEVSDNVILILQGKEFNHQLNKQQMELLEKFISQQQKVNISNYILYEDVYKTSEENTNGVEIINNQCYINKNDIVYRDVLDHGEIEARVVCNGYYTFLLRDSIIDAYPYDKAFRFLGYYKDEIYHFAYQPYGENATFIVNIGNDITISFENIDDIKLSTIPTSQNGSKIIGISIIGGIIVFILWILNKYKENNTL